MVTERADAFSGPRLRLYIELFEFCGSFRDSAHDFCIKGANHATGGVLKSTLVVDNHSFHACTVAFSTQSWPPVSLITDTDAHSVNGSRKRFTAQCDTQSYSFIVVFFFHFFFYFFFPYFLIFFIIFFFSFIFSFLLFSAIWPFLLWVWPFLLSQGWPSFSLVFGPSCSGPFFCQSALPSLVGPSF